MMKSSNLFLVRLGQSEQTSDLDFIEQLFKISSGTSRSRTIFCCRKAIS